MKFIERLKGYARTAVGYLRNERGQATSLTELTVAIAVGLTLTASLAPIVINVGDDAAVTRAKSDLTAIKKAINGMFADTREFPVRSTAGSKVSVPISSGETAVTYLRSGNVTSGTDKGRNPDFKAAGAGTRFATETSAHLLNNHIRFDTSGACGTTPCSLLYKKGGTGTGTSIATPVDWKGPYVDSEIFQDPWSANYIVLTLGAIVPPTAAGQSGTIDGVTQGPTLTANTNNLRATTQLYAWVLSAGPNGKLQTSDVDSATSGDDIGSIFAVISATDPSKAASKK